MNNIKFNSINERINYFSAIDKIDKYQKYDSEIYFFESRARFDLIELLKKYDFENKKTIIYAVHRISKSLKLLLSGIIMRYFK